MTRQLTELRREVRGLNRQVSAQERGPRSARLKTSDAVPTWEALPPWPGVTRALAVMAAHRNAMYANLTETLIRRGPTSIPPIARRKRSEGT